PMMQGTGSPEFLAITVTAGLPLSDTYPYQGITKTVYFSNNGEGVLTLTVEITGTAPLTLAAGAAFDEGERVYTSGVAPTVLEVTYTIRTTHETQASIPYTVTDGIPLTATVAITFVRDITAPVVTIGYPANPIWISVTLNITGTATDEGSGVRRVEVATDTIWVSASGTELWEYLWYPPTGQNGTAYTISAQAKDYLGIGSWVATRAITVDNVMTGTVSNLTSTSHITDAWSNRNTITVTWDAADDGPGIGLGGYAVLWDTSPSTDPTAVNLDAASTSTSTTLADGDNHYFHIQAVDGLMNRGSTLHLGPFKVDTASPTATIMTPSAGTWLTTTHQPTFVVTGTATDERSGVAWVDVTTGTTWVSATGTTSWQYTWTLPTADNAVYTLTARAWDHAGNQGISANVPVTVDTVAPTAAAPSPHRSPWVTSTVVYTWPASTDGSGIAGYRVNITNTAGYTATLWAPNAVLTFTAALTEGAGYFARVRAVDGAGNEGDWSGLSSVVTPDLTAPTIIEPYITGQAGYFSITLLTVFYTNTSGVAKTFSVGGNANDGGPSGLDRATFSAAFGSAPGDDQSPGAFSGSYDVPSGATESGLITVTIYDNSGNSATQAYTYTYDGFPPVNGAITIAGGAGYVSTTTVSLSLSSTDNITGCGVNQMCLSNGPTCSSWQSYATSAPWTLDGSDGEKTVYVWFRDYLNNTAGPFTDTVFLDRAAPTGAITIAGGSPYTTDITVTLTITATDPPPASGIASMRLSNDGTSWAPWETFATTRQWTLDGGSDSLKTVYVQFQDKAGNVSALFTDTITLDRQGPTVSIFAPTAGQVLSTTHQPTFVVTGTATDERSGVAWVDVTTGTTWVSATGTTSWQYTWTLPTADNAVYTLTARAWDHAGNQGISANVPVTVDTVAPTAAAPSPHRSPWVTSTVVYTWPASTDGSGIAGYRVNITNTAGYTATLWAPNAVLTFTAALTEGAGYFARVRAVDGAGNEGDWSGLSSVVTPDLTAPTVAVTAPAQTANTTFPVSWSATDGGSGVDFYRVEYQQDGGVWQTWIPITTTTGATFTGATLEHTYTFRVTAYDKVGNAGEGQATTRVAKWRVYIPLVLRNWKWWYQYDPYEPNDTPAQAWGPLQSGQTYTAFIWDETDMDDYYWITPTTSNSVTVYLTNIPSGSDFDLYIYYYYDGAYHPVAQSNFTGNASEQVSFAPNPGTKYYIRVYRFGGSGQYQLKATYQ
ncbi:MAG: Ig-like domain-containing protein, partial [Anaerolineae bacterium]